VRRSIFVKAYPSIYCYRGPAWQRLGSWLLDGRYISKLHFHILSLRAILWLLSTGRFCVQCFDVGDVTWALVFIFCSYLQAEYSAVFCQEAAEWTCINSWNISTINAVTHFPRNVFFYIREQPFLNIFVILKNSYSFLFINFHFSRLCMLLPVVTTYQVNLKVLIMGRVCKIESCRCITNNFLFILYPLSNNLQPRLHAAYYKPCKTRNLSWSHYVEVF
jgi:hypothetical protein